MRVIGVLDLTGGRAVHARGGRRDEYAPVQQVAGRPIHGDPVALARTYVERLGIDELYVADLDAITSGTPQHDAVCRLAAVGAPLWLDAGVSSADAARASIQAGAARVIVGLETLSSFEALAGICDAVGGDRVAFSVDLRGGTPIYRSGTLEDGAPPEMIAAHAAEAGASAIIVLDLARVGTGSGLDLALISRVRNAVPHLTLLVGGGVYGPDDLAQLAAAGCEGALVASALHDGRITADDVATTRQFQGSISR